MLRKSAVLVILLATVAAACSPAATPPPPTPTEAMMEKPTEEAMAATPTEGAMMGTPTEDAMMEKPTEDAMMEKPTEDAMMETPTEDAMMAHPTEEAMMGEMTSAKFVNGEVITSGSYSLDPQTGELKFSADFKVSTGPDLVVLLSGASDLNKDFQAFSTDVAAASQLSLGELKNTAGEQTYQIPTGTDLSQYKTVVIWCKSFNVDFGAAPLMP